MNFPVYLPSFPADIERNNILSQTRNRQAVMIAAMNTISGDRVPVIICDECHEVIEDVTMAMTANNSMDKYFQKGVCANVTGNAMPVQMGLTALKTAIVQDQAIRETAAQVCAVKHECDCLWCVAEWILNTFCGWQSPATLAQSLKKRAF